MKGLSAGRSREGASRASSRRAFKSGSWRAFRSVVAVMLAIAFVPIVPISAFASPTPAGPLTIDSNYIFANGAPITISADATSGIDIAWKAGTYNGVAYEAGTYNYTGTDASVFGGSQNAAVSSSSITMVSGTVAALHGGGRGTTATTPGDADTASVIMEGGIADSVMGGGENYSSVLDTTVFISGGTVAGAVFAGGLDDSTTGTLDQLKSYYTMKAAGGTDDPLLYTNNYTGTSRVTIQGNAVVESVNGSGAEDTITDSSTIALLGGQTALSYASYYNSLCYDSTISISGNTTKVSVASLLYGKAYAGNIDMTVTGGTVGYLEVGTLTDALHDGMGEVLGNTQIAVKDDLIQDDSAFITGTFDGNLSITGNTAYTLYPADNSNMTAIPDGAKWEADTATIIIEKDQTLNVDGTLIAGNIDNHGRLVVEDGSVTVDDTLTNESDGKIQVRGTASLKTLNIKNSGLVTRGELAAVSCTNVDLHTVLCSSDTGGSMSPQGYVVVADGDTLACTITPDTNNTIQAILLDGTPVASPSASYSLTDVRANHTLESVFQLGYDIALDPAALDFGNALVGYTAPASQTVTITNTGLGTLSITGIASDSSNFTITPPSVAELAPGSAVTFTVQPVSNLALGDYTATISIDGSNISTRTVTASFSVIDPVAMIGTTPYVSLQDAFDASVDGDTVTLMKDVTLDNPLKIATAGTVTLASKAKLDGTFYTISPSDGFDANALSMIEVPTSANPTTLLVMDINLKGNVNVSARAFYVGGQNTVNINAGAKIQEFHLLDSEDENAILDGAAIYSVGANININGGEISNNVTVASGGAVYMGNDPAKLSTGVLTVRGGIIHDNSAGEVGGAVAIGALRSMTWTGGSIVNNSATAKSNDIALIADEESAARLTLKTPITAMLSTVITGDVCGVNNTHMTIAGRGTYGQLGIGTYTWDPVTATWFDSACIARITNDNGSIYYYDLGEAFADAANGQTIVIVNNATVTKPIVLQNNTNATKTVTLEGTPEAANIVALGADVGDSLFTIPDGIKCSLVLNDVNIQGSADYDTRCIYVGNDNSLEINEGTSITGFTTKLVVGGTPLVGSAICSTGAATININAGTISANKCASACGGIFMAGKGGVLNIAGGKITGNSANSLAGGIVLGPSCNMYWSGGTISGNTVNGDAKDIMVTGSEAGYSILHLSGNITPDMAVILGSTVGMNAAQMILGDGAVEVWSEGLKIWVPQSAVCRIGLALYESIQDAFDAVADGGTITLMKDVAVADDISVSTAGAVTLTSDVATWDDGGQPESYYSLSPSSTFADESLITLAPDAKTTLTITNIGLSGSSMGCRAIYAGTGDVVKVTTGADIWKFSSTIGSNPSGSAVYLDNNARMTMDAGDIHDNLAVGSGAIYLAGTSELTLSGGTIQDNRADGLTGGVYVGNTAKLSWAGGGTISGSFITDDVANDVFIYSDLASSGLVYLTAGIHVPNTTIITGTTDDAESFYSILAMDANCSYAKLAPTVMNGYLWSEVGGTYAWLPAVAIDRMTGENIMHGYFSVTDAINLSGEMDAVYIMPAALNTQASRTLNVDVFVDHDMSINNTTGDDLTLLMNNSKLNFDINSGVELILNAVTVDIVNGRYDCFGTVSFANGGAILPTIAVKTQVTPSLATSEGSDASMTFEAEKTAGSTTNAIVYQWYECSNAVGDNPKDIKGATSSTFDIEYGVGTSGTHYYCCVADLNGITLGSAICTVTVAPADVSLKISDPNPSTFEDVTYGYTTGSSVTYTITNTGVTTLTNIKGDSHLADGDEFTYVFALGFNGTLAPGESTTVTITSNAGLHAGDYAGTFTAACDEYTPGVSIALDQYVMPKALNVFMVEEVADVTYTGHPIVPEVHLSFGDQELVEGTDYTYTCTDNVDAGWADINVTAVDGSDFTGSTTGDFKILKASLNDAVAAPIADQTYTGSEIRPELSLTFNGVAVPSDAYRTYFINNTDVGIADIFYYVVLSKNFETLTGGDANFKIVRTGTASWTRLAGTNRYETMSKIVDEAFPKTSGTVFLATGEGYADTLSASCFAGLLDAPIITTSPKTLSAEAASEITRLGASKVYIIGGTAAVSQEVEDAVRAIPGVGSVERIAGADRVDTCYQIYTKWVSLSGYSDTCVIARSTTFPDALSMAPYCYSDSTPIFLANADGTLSANVQAVVKKFSQVIVLGGTGGEGAISDDTMNSLALKGKWMRLAGLSGDRYGTSLTIALWTTGMMKDAAMQPHAMARLSLDGMAVATGENYPDALVSVGLLGRNHSALLLVSDSPATEANILGFIQPNKNLITKGYVLGGESAVDATVMGWLEKATK